MATKFKRGDAVVQILPAPITGVVSDFSLDKETGEVHIIVETLDADGNAIQVRDFKETEIDFAVQPE